MLRAKEISVLSIWLVINSTMSFEIQKFVIAVVKKVQMFRRNTCCMGCPHVGMKNVVYLLFKRVSRVYGSVANNNGFCIG
jgi:hypothetical protein